MIVMPRPLRELEPGGTYHVTAHAVHNSVIVDDDVDRLKLVEYTQRTVRRFEWECLALCVMDTHYHLLLTTPQPNLSAGMQYLNGCYAQNFNRRHGRRGALFRERYWDDRVVADGHLAVTLRYIAMNPVVVDLASEPAGYRWSSYAGVVGAAPCWSFVAKSKVLGLFGPEREAVVRIRALVEGTLEPPRVAA